MLFMMFYDKIYIDDRFCMINTEIWILRKEVAESRMISNSWYRYVHLWSPVPQASWDKLEMLHRDITMIHKSSPCQVPPMVNGDRLSIVDHRPDIQSRLKSSRKPCPLKNDVRHPKPEREVNIILTFLMQIRDDLNFRILCGIGPRSGYIDIVIFATNYTICAINISSSTFF